MQKHFALYLCALLSACAAGSRKPSSPAEGAGRAKVSQPEFAAEFLRQFGSFNENTQHGKNPAGKPCYVEFKFNANQLKYPFVTVLVPDPQAPRMFTSNTGSFEPDVSLSDVGYEFFLDKKDDGVVFTKSGVRAATAEHGPFVSWGRLTSKNVGGSQLITAESFEEDPGRVAASFVPHLAEPATYEKSDACLIESKAESRPTELKLVGATYALNFIENGKADYREAPSELEISCKALKHDFSIAFDLQGTEQYSDVAKGTATHRQDGHSFIYTAPGKNNLPEIKYGISFRGEISHHSRFELTGGRPMEDGDENSFQIQALDEHDREIRPSVKLTRVSEKTVEADVGNLVVSYKIQGVEYKKSFVRDHATCRLVAHY